MTLAEVLVASFVMSIVLFGTYSVLVQGMSYFRSNQNALDAQRSGLVLLSKLTSELENSAYTLVDCNDYSAVYGDVYGVVFAGPINSAGVMAVNTDGALYYQDYISYYLWGTTIRRQQLAISPQNINPSPPGANYPIAWWGYHSSAPISTVAQNVQQFFVLLYGPDAFQVTIYAGDNNMLNLEGYWMKLQTIIFPRNVTAT